MKVSYLPSKYYLYFVYLTTLNSKYLRTSAAFHKVKSGEKNEFFKDRFTAIP